MSNDLKTAEEIASLKANINNIGINVDKGSKKIDELSKKIQELRECSIEILGGFKNQKDSMQEIKDTVIKSNDLLSKTVKRVDLLDAWKQAEEKKDKKRKQRLAVIVTIIGILIPVVWFFFRMSVEKVVDEVISTNSNNLLDSLLAEVDPCVINLDDCVFELIK